MDDMDFSYYSDIGGRENNEDSQLVKKTSKGYLFIVADGLGGHDKGETASLFAVNAVKDYIVDNDSEDIVGAVEHANDIILSLQKLKSSKMKTTIALAYATETETVIAHVGDSRVYAFKNGRIIWQTKDHSASQLAVSMGDITSDEIRRHEDRNMLLRALGNGETVKTEVFRIMNEEYDALLLCTDGFWEYVLESDMEAALADSTTAVKWLYEMRNIQLKNAPKNCDNNTAVAVMA